MKKLALFLAVVLLLTAALPVEVMAAKEEVLASGKIGKLKWSVTEDPDTADVTLTVSGKGDMPDLTFYDPLLQAGGWSCEPPWALYFPTNVIVKKGVTGIGAGFLWGTAGMSVESVSLPEGLTRIGDYAFFGCHELEKLRIPKSVKTIGCGVLTTVSGVTIDDNPWFQITDGLLLTKDGKRLLCAAAGSERCVVPEGVERIDAHAFAGVPFDITVSIPASVSEIGTGALGNVAALTLDEANSSFRFVDGALLSRDGKRLLAVFSEEETFAVPEGVETVEDYAFYQMLARSLSSPGVGQPS